MRTWIVPTIVVLLAITGCKQLPNKPARQTSSPPPNVPLPAGLKPAPYVRNSIVPTTATPSYVPTDFALTSVRRPGGSVVLAWQNGTPPFQVQVKTNVLSDWVDFGPVTTLRQTTNSAPVSKQAFFKVKSVAVTPGQLTWIATNGVPAAACVNGIKVDRADNVIAVGLFYGSVTFSGITLTSVGAGDVFIVKRNNQGVIKWAKSFGGTGDDFGRAVAIDEQDNIIVTGDFFSPTINAGGTNIPNASGQTDVFLAKFSPTGQHIWSRGFGGVATDFASAVGTDTIGNVFVISRSGNVINFGGGIVLTGFGGTDIALVKFSSAGVPLWAKLRGGSFHDQAFGLVVDPAGDVLLTGDCGDGDLGGGPVTAGFFLAKYSGADGSYRFARTVAGGFGYGITTAGNDNIIVTGRCAGSANFGGGAISTSPNVLFIAGFNPSGNYLWAQGYGGDLDRGNAVTVDADGIVTFTGQINGLVSFGGGYQFGNGSPNCFIASFTTSGNSPPVYRWDKRVQGGTSNGLGLAYDALGHVTVGGCLSGGIVSFDGILVSGSGFVGSSFAVQYSK